MFKPQLSTCFPIILLFFALIYSVNAQEKLFLNTQMKKEFAEGFEYQSLEIDQSVFKQIKKSKSETLELEIPYLDKMLTVTLERYDLLTHDFKASSSTQEDITYTPGLYYRGKIKSTGGLVAFSFFNDEMFGILSTKDGKYLNLGKPKLGTPNEYVLYDASKLKNPISAECHSDKLPEYADQLANLYNNVGNNKMMDCVNVYVEGDYDLFLSKGGVTQTIDYLTGLWNPVSTIYNNDGMTVNISEIFVWETQDPYSTSSSGDALNDFRNEVDNFNGDLAHLMALGGNGLGGVAWLDVLCSNNFNYAYSNIGNWYNNFPNYSWTVMVVSHEMGHNIGSPHTHNCSWAGGAIDNCYETEGNCSPGPSPTNGGTVMSYCHLTGNGINLNNGFGPLPTSLMVDKINGAGCLGGCTSVSNPPIADFIWTVNEPCVSGPAEVQFFNASTENPTSYFWTFPGGSPSTSSAENPIVTYSNAGIYDATLEVTNAFGNNSLTQTNIFVIEDIPNAFFTVDIDGRTITLTNLSDNAEYFDWYFGDGNLSFEFEPTYTYDEDGSYTLVLDAFNDCDVDAYVLNIVIATEPVAQFSLSNGEGCSIHEVTFTNLSSSNANDYLWTFEGGTPETSTEQNVTVTYEVAGQYDVIMTAFNETGSDSYQISDAVSINDIPNTTFNYDINNAVVSLSNQSINAQSYFWDFGDGITSTESNPNHTYDDIGFYTVILTSTNECGSSEHVEFIEIAIQPSASMSFDIDSGCADLDVLYTNTSTYATEVSWYFEGGNPSTSTEQNPQVSYSSEGTYAVELTVTNAYGSDVFTYSDAINVIDVPTTQFTYSTNGGEVTFTNNTIGGNNPVWSFGDGSSTNYSDSPVYTFAESGSYLVSLNTENSCGQSEFSETITVIYEPNISIQSNLSETCLPATITFADASSDAESIEWYFPGGDPEYSTESNPTVVYYTVGSFDVTLTASNAFGTSEATFENYIEVIAEPSSEFDITGSGLSYTMNFNGEGEAVEWNFGDGTSANDISTQHTFAEEGTYLVTATSSNLCGSDSSEQTILAYTQPSSAFSIDQNIVCVNESLTITNESSANTTDQQWLVNDTTYDTKDLTVSFDEVGSYDVRLVASNPLFSDTLLMESVITVIDIPTASFNFDQNLLDVQFDNLSNMGTAYMWEFGDGNTSTESEPSVTYEEEGTYTISLEVSNQCGIEAVSQEILAYTPPTADFSIDNTVVCIDEEVNLSNLSSQNITALTWVINGEEFTQDSLTTSFSQPGEYNIELIVSNPVFSDTMTMNNVIKVIDVPEANFDYSISGLSLITTNLTEAADAYFWDFGDGITSTEFQPNHEYEKEDFYTITLTVTNKCGSTTREIAFNNFSQPSADFSFSDEVICVGDNIDFANQSSINALDYSWSFEGGSPEVSSSNNPSIQYNTTGTYTATLEVSNPAGTNAYTHTQQIVVIDQPSAQFMASSQAFELTTTNMSQGVMTNYLWDFGDGSSSSEESPSHIYSAEGEYTITLTTSNQCGSDVSTQQVTIINLPVADFDIQSVTEYCAPATVQFINNSSSNVESYVWSFPGGSPSSSSEPDPVITYDSAGSYDVTLEVSNSTGSDMIFKESIVIVNDMPTSDFEASISEVTISMNTQSARAETFAWYVNNALVSQEPDYTFEPETNGTYDIVHITENDCGISESSTSIVVTIHPNAGFDIDKDEVCESGAIQFQADFAENLTYNWTFEGGSPQTSSDQNPIITYNSSGLYSVTLNVTNIAGDTEVVRQNIINVQPQPFATYNISLLDENLAASIATTNGDIVEWIVNGTTYSQNSIQHVFEASGDYMIQLSVTNDCGTRVYQEELEVDLNEFDFDLIEIAPNPADHQIVLLSNSRSINTLRFRLHDITGKYVDEGVFDNGNRTYDVSHLSQGVYIVSIYNGITVKTKRLMIAR